uniref:RGS domain-containing protein n=1 Tax=Anopheles culicifacies TaxID=139723 RepID=A0A182M565_9DIPT
MAMDPPDVVLSPERESSIVATGSGSKTTTAALLQLQHRTHPQTPPAAFHLAGGDAAGHQQRSVLLLQQSSTTTSTTTMATVTPPCGSSSSAGAIQHSSIAVPTALLASAGQLQSVAGGSNSSAVATPSSLTSTNVSQPAPPIERLSRPMAFDKMESLVREMQDSENGVPVRSQKLFLTSIPSAFMGYDLIEWLMERLSIEESEALNISNQLCQHGYFFPVSDSKTLMVKDDSSLYRFQTPYYWPWQQKAPDQIEYAIYLAKRSLRNKQRHGLEDYETEALASLHKNLKGKWDFILMQAEEQVRLAKDRKKGDKIVGDSQERAYWRVHRPPPGQFTPLEPCPIPSRDRQGKPRKRTVEDWQREVDILKASLGRNRVKMSQACESLVVYYETFSEYDPMMQPPLPSNPWVTEDVSFWQLNNPVVEIPTEKRVKRWGISIEEVVSDPTGLQEFTHYLKKEYSHENIRFWMAVNDLRRSSHSQISRKVKEIYEEFLEPGAPCEINIDGKTMEKVQQGLKNPSRFAFDAAAEHIYTLLLKKDCYPRFVRSEHYKSLMVNAIQPSLKKRFFGFGGGAKKKGSTSTAPNPSMLTQPSSGTAGSGNVNSLSKRRGSDRSLSGSAHELAISGVKDCSKVPHSHSQSNLSDIPYSVSIYRGDMPSGVYEGVSSSSSSTPLRGNARVADRAVSRDSLPCDVFVSTLTSNRLTACPVFFPIGRDVNKNLGTTLEVTLEGSVSGSCAVCPWDTPVIEKPASDTSVSVSVCPWDSADAKPPTKTDSSKLKQYSELPHSTTEISEVSERMKRSCGLRQNTLDGDFHSTKRLAPVVTEQRRASMTMAPRLSDLQFSPTISEETVALSGGTNLVAAGTTPNERLQDRHRQKSSEECAEAIKVQDKGVAGDVGSIRARDGTLPQPLLATVCSTGTIFNVPSDSTNMAAAQHIVSAGSVPVTTKPVCYTPTTTTICTSSAAMGGGGRETMDANSQRPTNVDTAPESTTGTPRISVIYANTPEEEQVEVELQEKEGERNEDQNAGVTETEEKAIGQQQGDLYRMQSFEGARGGERQNSMTTDGINRSEHQHPAGTSTAATQTIDVLQGNVGQDMSPLTEVEDGFYVEALRQQTHGTTGLDSTEYDIIMDGGDSGLLPGCVAPAPTPAPSIAPLAEVELDPPDDEADADELEQSAGLQAIELPEPPSSTSGTATVVIVDDLTKRRKRKDRKDRGPEQETIRAQKSEEENSERKGNAVCPWDDESESAADDAPYVKTYSTLGYL